MSEEHLPEPFNRYWNIQKEIPKMKQVSVTKENLSNEWISFLEAINNRVKKDLQQEK